MDSNISSKKIELIQWLSTLSDIKVIDKIMEIRAQESDWWDEISEAEKASIEKGIQDAQAGKTKPHSEAKKIYGKWL